MSLSILVIAVVVSWASARETSPEVITPAGTFRGKILTSYGGHVYASYRGIPYALPPTGDRRFALPVPYPAIKGVYDATQFGSVCLQNNHGAILGKEDCLYLNVYTPVSGQETQHANLKKVLVFIHGGGCIVGGSNLYLPGDIVTTGDIIVVIINYRLNWFGFLRGNSSSLPANLGYKDQVLALRWVQDNIRHFGGDPSDVTLSGESAGAKAAAVLSLSPLAKGLFSKVLLLSGSIIDFPIPDHTSNELLQVAADKFGCGVASLPGNEESVVACLKMVPAEDFVADFDFRHINPFLAARDDLLPRPPKELLEDPKYLLGVGFLSRDFIVSITADDGYIFVNSIFFKVNTTSKSSSVQFLRQWTNMSEKITELVLREYEILYGDREKAVINLITDSFFLKNGLALLKVFRKHEPELSKNNVFLMSFDHRPRYVPKEYMLHALDLVYLFDVVPNDLIGSFYFVELDNAFYEEDVEMKSQFIDLVTTFMKTRNPSELVIERKNVVWPPYELDKKYYLSFSLQPSIHEDIFRSRRAIWETLVPQWLEEQQLSDSKQEL